MIIMSLVIVRGDFMKRELVVGSWIFNIILAFVCGYFYFYWHTQTSLQAQIYTEQSAVVTSHKLSVERYSLAIIVPATHKALEEIQRGFEKTIVKKYGLNTVFKVYNANGNRALLRAQIEEVALGKFDAVFCIGAVATQLTKEVFIKKNVKTPIVFGAVADPVGIGLIQSLQHGENILTGSAAMPDYHTQVDLLMLLKPEIKQVLLVYDPSQSSGLEADSQKVAKEFAALGVEFKKVEVSSVRDVQQKVPLLIGNNIDVIMILKDNTVVPAVDMLVRLCDRHGVTLYVSDLDSVRKGAALGFGVHEHSFGSEAAVCAYKIIHDKLEPWQVPAKLTNNFKFAINKAKLAQQNVKLSKKFDKLLKMVEIFDDNPPSQGEEVV
jgi:putative tryptophan/tyrosine transport system substrate-binding protein